MGQWTRRTLLGSTIANIAGVRLGSLASGDMDTTVGLLIDSPQSLTRASIDALIAQNVYSVSGADPTGAVDSTRALQAALDAISRTQGGAVRIPPGRYRHTGLTVMGKSGFTILGDGAELICTATDKAYINFTSCSDFTVLGLRSSGANFATRRNLDRGFMLRLCKRFALNSTIAHHTESVGYYISGCEDGALIAPVVHNTLADGIHIVHGSRRLTVSGPVAHRTGDDAIVVWSVDNGVDPICQDITVSGAVITQSFSRGLVVVGGERIIYSGFTINETKNAGVYIANEVTAAQSTHPVRDVRVSSGIINRPCTFNELTVHRATSPAKVNMGGVHVAFRNDPAKTRDVSIERVTVRDAPWRSVSLSGHTITVEDCKIMNGGDDGIHSAGTVNLRITGNEVDNAWRWGIVNSSADTGWQIVSGNVVTGANRGAGAGMDAIDLNASTILSGGGLCESNIIVDTHGTLDQGLQARTDKMLVSVNCLGSASLSLPASRQVVRAGYDLRLHGKFGLEKPPVGVQSVSAAASDATTTRQLVNSLRAAMMNFGLVR